MSPNLLRHTRISPPASPPPRNFFDRLPVELLTEIFSCCVQHVEPIDQSGGSTHYFEDMEDQIPELPTCSSYDGPVALSHVCRRWRSVAIEHRRLWTRLRIDFRDDLISEHHDHTNLFKDERAVHAFARRSGNLPLTIFLNYLHIPMPLLTRAAANEQHTIQQWEVSAVNVLKAVLLYSDRIQQFGMAMPEWLMAAALHVFNTTALPQLQALHIMGHAPQGPTSGVNLGLLPRIQDVTLSGLHLKPFIAKFAPRPPGPPSETPISLNSLTLSNCLPPYFILELLCFQKWFNVQNLHIEFGDELASSCLHIPGENVRLLMEMGIVLPAVTSLTLVDHSTYGFNAWLLLLFLRMGTLERLRLAVQQEIGVDMGLALMRMLQVSKPPLKALDLWDVPITDEFFVEVLKQTAAHLEEIVVDASLLTTFTADALAWPQSAPIPHSALLRHCSKLRRITFRGSQPEDTDAVLCWPEGSVPASYAAGGNTHGAESNSTSRAVPSGWSVWHDDIILSCR